MLCIFNISDNVLVVSTKLKEPVTGLAWDYSNAYEFSTVNECGVSFWILEEKSGTLQVYTPSTDKEVSDTHWYTGIYTGILYGILVHWYIHWYIGIIIVLFFFRQQVFAIIAIIIFMLDIKMVRDYIM